MKIILATGPIKYPLTSIGWYSLELVKRLAVVRKIEESKLFHSTSFIGQIPWVGNEGDAKASNHGRLSAFLCRQPLLIEAYHLLHPQRQAWALRDCKDYIYRGPNFYLPYRLGRIMTTLHDISIFACPEYHPKGRVCYMEKSLRGSLDSTKLILTVSGFSRSEIIRLFNYPTDRIITTKLACSSDYIPRSPVEYLLVLRKYQLAWQGYASYIGTMEPRKNIRGLLQAYQLLPMRARTRYPLVLSDYRGWEDDVLWQLVERGTRGGWIRYLSYVPDEDLPYLYATARTFVCPSFYKGLGSPILEVMSCDVPIVRSNVTSLLEVIGDAGLVADPNDVDTIGAYILQGLQDDSQREVATACGLA